MNLLSLAVTTVASLGIAAAPALATPVMVIRASTGEFLGGIGSGNDLCSETDFSCIWNPLSEFGSRTGAFSIFNNSIEYGSPTGVVSVCNPNPAPGLFIGIYWIDDTQILLVDVISQDSSTELGQELYKAACL